MALLIGGTVLTATIGGLLLAASDAVTQDHPVTAVAGTAQAEALLSTIVTSEGSGWGAGADSLGRLGLADANGALNLTKMEAMRGASFAATANGLLDYDESTSSLGLDQAGPGGSGLQYHLRVAPVGLQAALANTDLSHIRVAYIGDWSGFATAQVSLHLDNETLMANADAQHNLTMGSNTAEERDMLAGLGLGFTNRVDLTDGAYTDVEIAPLVFQPLTAFIPLSLAAGDVFPDDKTYLANEFIPRIDEYHIIVVGSAVDHSELTQAVFKDGVRDWVLAGGDLMVYGSGNQNFQWLQPLFDVGTTTVNGQAVAPDVTHPMLHEPNELDWSAYDNLGIGWDIKQNGEGAHYDDFEHVIQQGGEDLLAVSIDGAFGDGRIYLTAFQPKLVAAAMGQAEAQNFVHNMVVYADRDYLYLDYGPSIPDDTDVYGAVRHAWIADPDLGQVPVRVELLLWSG